VCKLKLGEGGGGLKLRPMYKGKVNGGIMGEWGGGGGGERESNQGIVYTRQSRGYCKGFKSPY
jgi:hypothetical protein